MRSSLCTSAVPHLCSVSLRVILWDCLFHLNGKVVWEGGDQSILLEAPPVACAGGEGEGLGSVGTPVVQKSQREGACRTDLPSGRVSGESVEDSLPAKSCQKASLVACPEKKEALCFCGD